MNKFNLEDRVTVLGKNITGKIAYIGETHFSDGEWFGVILDEAKGRNNGSINGERYFKCPRNHGLFVRSCQLEKQEIQYDGSNKGPHTAKLIYPNYLRHNSAKSSEPHATTEIRSRRVQSSMSQIRPQSMVIRDLQNFLKKQTSELIKVKDQNKKAEKMLKIKENELQRLSKKLNKMITAEKNAQKELTVQEEHTGEVKMKDKDESLLNISKKKRSKLIYTMEQLEEITESVVIEKEISEEKSEYFELLLKDEQDKNKTLEIELDMLKEEMQLQSIDGVPAIHYVKNLENRNAVLNNSLMKLVDIYHRLKQKVLDYQKVAENKFKEIEGQKLVQKTLEEAICNYKREVIELCDTIDEMMNADEVVIEVVEKNLNFETKLNHLQEALEDSEVRMGVDEEIEETLQEINSLCNEEINCLDVKVKNTKMFLNQIVFLLKDREETIAKYRELTTHLRHKNEKLEEEFKIVLKERNETVTAVENFKLKSHLNEKKIMSDVIQSENIKYDLEGYETQLKYWSEIMPENFFKAGGENSAIQAKVTINKMIRKSDLLIHLMRSSFHKLNDILKEEQLRSLSSEVKFLIFACRLSGFLKICNRSYDYADVEDFLALGKYLNIIMQKNDELDVYLKLFTNREIDRQNCLDSIRGMYVTLSQLLDTKHITKAEETMTHVESYLEMIEICCKCISAFSLSLDTLERVPSDYITDIKKGIENAKNLKTVVSVLLKAVKNCENLSLQPVVKDRVEKSWDFIHEMMECVVSFYEMFQEEDELEWKNTRGVTLRNAVCRFTQAHNNLSELKKELNSGKLFVENTQRSQKLSPIKICAQRREQERKMHIDSLRNKIKSCELEISNLTQNIETQKKANAVQVNEKILKDASQQTEKCSASLLSGTDDNSTRIEYLMLKLYDMECSMRYLSQKNFQLMLAPARDHLDHLPPLTIRHKPKFNPNTHVICELQKRLNRVAVKLRTILLPTVVDITKKNRNNEKQYKLYLETRKRTSSEIKDELWNIVVEVKRLKTAPRCIWSNTSKPFYLPSIRYVEHNVMQ